MSVLRALNIESIEETHAIVRRRVPCAALTIERFMAIMRRENFSGTVTITLHQGGVRKIVAEDSQSVTP